MLENLKFDTNVINTLLLSIVMIARRRLKLAFTNITFKVESKVVDACKAEVLGTFRA